MAGIEMLKTAVKFGVNLSEGIASKLDDKKLTALEALSLLPELFPLVELIRNGPLLWEQLEDIDEDELQELYDFAKEELDLPNDVVEEKVEKAIGIAVAIADFLTVGNDPLPV